MPAPWCAALVLQHRLEKAAMKAQRQWRLTVEDRQARGQCKCVYMGRKASQADDVFVANATDWPDGITRQSQAIVTFQWQDASGVIVDRDVAADKAWTRGVPPPASVDDGTFTGADTDLPDRMRAAAGGWRNMGVALDANTAERTRCRQGNGSAKRPFTLSTWPWRACRARCPVARIMLLRVAFQHLRS